LKSPPAANPSTEIIIEKTINEYETRKCSKTSPINIKKAIRQKTYCTFIYYDTFSSLSSEVVDFS